MRQTFVVVSIVVGLLLWVVAIANAEPAKYRLAVLQASAAGPAADAVAVVAIQAP